MALFSFRHSVKTFSPRCESASRHARQGQTAAHLRYITRASAAREVLRVRLDHPTDAAQARAVEQEAERRKGRVCERFIVALPVETTEAERVALARAFAEDLTKGKAGYVLAIHDKTGNDIRNPHFHLIAFDQHERSGGRGRPRSVIGMARKNAVEATAKRWAEIHNQNMRDWGYDAASMIDHRSYADQGRDRIPQIHEGPAARQMARQGKTGASKETWRRIDGGQSRAQANALIKEINTLKEEIKDERDDRLGSRNHRNTGQGDECRPPFRTHDKRSGRGAKNTAGPIEKTVRPGKTPDPDRQPPWVASSSTERLTERVGTHPKPKAQPPLSSDLVGLRGPYARRRPIRRIFVELLMLRDTLRARLATYGGRRHALPTAQAVRERIQLSNEQTRDRSDCVLDRS
ncbi:MobA/MobL family protein [Pseudaestuariivita rosea]|uniref:MobA/MobL family protein n=1 Tax=Pseudaestuariivita rosea TaxID=2763263 RepID=UPI001ABA1D54|nr:MobA/MobL family protein [Pseudaestuariivita rosea]